jgi:hypothetical protein
VGEIQSFNPRAQNVLKTKVEGAKPVEVTEDQKNV